jgi:inner membrane protein
MDNVCHTLVGMAVARTGLQQKTALATATAAIAANLPDIDVLVFLWDTPAVAFRRGITHGVPAQVLLPIGFAALMWWIGRRRGRDVRFWWLLALSYIGILTHVFLDFLNTYGIRLLSPMSQRWFYGDAVFIVDLWLWLMLGLGVFWRGGILRRRASGRTSSRAAAAALVCASVYIGAMLVSARMARSIVRDSWIARTGEAPRALMVGPVPINPLRRDVIVDSGDRYHVGSFAWFPARVSFAEEAAPKNERLPGVRDAREDPRVRGILVWSRFPAWQVRDVDEGLEVRLHDMRFRGIDRGGFSATVIVPRPPGRFR